MPFNHARDIALRMIYAHLLTLWNKSSASPVDLHLFDVIEQLPCVFIIQICPI
jgi:hypothetical protein